MKVPCIVFIVCEVNPIIVSYHSLVQSQYCLVSCLQASIFTDSLQATALLTAFNMRKAFACAAKYCNYPHLGPHHFVIFEFCYRAGENSFSSQHHCDVVN